MRKEYFLNLNIFAQLWLASNRIIKFARTWKMWSLYKKTMFFSIPLGKHCRMSPLVFSLRDLFPGKVGRAKKEETF